MEAQDSKGKIIKETFPSEIISIIGDIFAGIVLSILILPFSSFPVLILMIPALLSLRGNLSGPFIARTSRDFIIGSFSSKSWFENVLATYILSIITAFFIGLFTMLLNLTIFIRQFLPSPILYFTIPLITIVLTLSISIPCSTGLNYQAFKKGLNPNNIVNPIMTAIDDFSTVFCFLLTIIMLGVP
ncbi:MAG: magnesium transporter [Candidatus Lokiarchaeota archaeon]|nr:magnesium transporter [Candidatus Lokiarchaeota archaeon]